MPEEKHHHDLFQHEKEDENEGLPSDVFDSGLTTADGDELLQRANVTAETMKAEDKYKESRGLGALVTGAFALVHSICPFYLLINSEVKGGVVATGGVALQEKHAEKKDPEHNYREKIEELFATAAAVVDGGYVFHEHREETKSKESPGKKRGRRY